MAAVEQVGWFWDSYRPDWKVPPGMSLFLPPSAPSDYVEAVESTMPTLLSELELYVRRKLAVSMTERVGEGPARILAIIRGALPEDFEYEDLEGVGLLAEIFGDAKGGKYWMGWKLVASAVKAGRVI